MEGAALPVTVKFSKRKAGQKAGLTRALIVTVLLQKKPELSVSKIAKALKVGRTAVYSHFPGGLPEIQSEMVRTLLANVAVPFFPAQSWESYLRLLFVMVFDAFRKHPEVAQFAGSVLAANYYLNPFLVERILVALDLAGLDDSAKIRGLDLVMASLIGMLTIECAGATSKSAEKWLDELASPPAVTPSVELPSINISRTKLLAAAHARTLGDPKQASRRVQRYADQLIVAFKSMSPKKNK